MRPHFVILLGTLVLVSGLGAQALVIPAGPVPLGGTATVTLVNNTGSLLFWAGSEFLLVRPTGEVADPRFVYQGDAINSIAPNQSLPMTYAVPGTLSGAPGSFVLLFPYGNRAAARLDIGAAAPAFPALHVFPTAVTDSFRTHAVDFTGVSPATIDVHNLSGASHSFAASDAIEIRAPGAAAALVAVPLGGLAVPAGSRVVVPLPISGLAPGPYTVTVTWSDPATGAAVRTFGIREDAQTDLHLPDGHVIPSGGRIETYLGLSGIAPGVLAAPAFAVVVGVAPGSTALPNGVLAPLSAADPLVLASFGGLGGLLSGNLGVASEVFICFCPPHVGYYDSGSVFLFHPNLPALSGATVRVAGVVFEPGTNFWGASQPEVLTLQ